MPLRWDGDGPACIATVRPRTLRRHPGEVCFPGGRREAEDRDLVETALREAREELGIGEAQVLGSLSSVPLYTSDFRLEPTVAAIGGAPLRPDPGEVEQVLSLSILKVLSRDRVDAIAYTLDGIDRLSPLFEIDGHLMYGGTAHVLYELLVVLAPLYDARVPPLVTGRVGWSDVLPEGGP